MSVDLYVFLRDQDVLSRDEWQRAIDSAGISLALDEFNPREHTGYLPAKLNDVDTGFEYYFGPTSEVSGIERSRLGGRDHYVLFVLHGDPTELNAAMFAAAVLTQRAAGLFLDPQSGEYAEASEVFAMIRRDEEAESARRRELAEKDADLTDRRCPQCGAPCPSYRKTCKACGYTIGRAE